MTVECKKDNGLIKITGSVYNSDGIEHLIEVVKLDVMILVFLFRCI